MGTLLGHALPGSFFLLFSIWRIIQIPRRLQLLQHCHDRAETKRKSSKSTTSPVEDNNLETHYPYMFQQTTLATEPPLPDRRPIMFFTSATYPCCLGMCARWPLEGIAKIVASAVGMAGELWASTDYGRAGRVTSIGDIQHVTMYSFFLISGILDVLRWKGVAWIVPGLDFIALSQAFFGQFLKTI